METLLIAVVIVLVIIMLNKVGTYSTDQRNGFNDLNQKIDLLKQQIEALQSVEKNIDYSKNKETSETLFSDEIVTQNKDNLSDFEEYDQLEQDEFAEENEEPVIIPEETILDEEPKELEEDIRISAFSSDDLVNEVKEQPVSEVFEKEFEPQKSWLEKFKENNPDIEKFIGENLINKIGILILVLGISFFVKYAIDKDWINEPARVGIGILSGAIVMGVAHRLRKKYAAFSSVFVAGAISIFYLTIGIAFHDYHLFSQTIASAIMVVITLFGVFVSLSYNRKELAVLSLIGGFAVPFMVSTGEGNYKVLLTYIAILNVGMLILSYFKK